MTSGKANSPYRIAFSRPARRAYDRADRALRTRLDGCWRQIEHDPRGHANSQPLHGPLSGLWRYRLGDLRIVYQIDDEERIVTIAAIAQRGSVYD